jgi:hypothetical protein
MCLWVVTRRPDCGSHREARDCHLDEGVRGPCPIPNAQRAWRPRTSTTTRRRRRTHLSRPGSGSTHPPACQSVANGTRAADTTLNRADRPATAPPPSMDQPRTVAGRWYMSDSLAPERGPAPLLPCDRCRGSAGPATDAVCGERPNGRRGRSSVRDAAACLPPYRDDGSGPHPASTVTPWERCGRGRSLRRGHGRGPSYLPKTIGLPDRSPSEGL